MPTKNEKLETRVTGATFKAFKRLAEKEHRTPADLLRLLVEKALEAK